MIVENSGFHIKKVSGFYVDHSSEVLGGVVQTKYVVSSR